MNDDENGYDSDYEQTGDGKKVAKRYGVAVVRNKNGDRFLHYGGKKYKLESTLSDGWIVENIKEIIKMLLNKRKRINRRKKGLVNILPQIAAENAAINNTRLIEMSLNRVKDDKGDKKELEAFREEARLKEKAKKDKEEEERLDAEEVRKELKELREKEMIENAKERLRIKQKKVNDELKVRAARAEIERQRIERDRKLEEEAAAAKRKAKEEAKAKKANDEAVALNDRIEAEEAAAAKLNNAKLIIRKNAFAGIFEGETTKSKDARKNAFKDEIRNETFGRKINENSKDSGFIGKVPYYFNPNTGKLIEINWFPTGYKAGNISLSGKKIAGLFDINNSNSDMADDYLKTNVIGYAEQINNILADSEPDAQPTTPLTPETLAQANNNQISNADISVEPSNIPAINPINADDAQNNSTSVNGAISDSDGLTNTQLTQMLAKVPGFIGVFPADRIPTVDSGSFIYNTSPAHIKTGHWRAVIVSPDVLEHYDSFGKPPAASFIKHFSNGHRQMKINLVKLQDMKSADCGWFCSKFLQDRLIEGQTFAEATKFDLINRDVSKRGQAEIEKFKKSIKNFEVL